MISEPVTARRPQPGKGRVLTVGLAVALFAWGLARPADGWDLVKYPHNLEKIETLQGEIDRLKQEVAPLAAPLIVDDADALSWLGERLFSAVLDAFDRLPDRARRAEFRSSRVRGRYAKDDWDCGTLRRGARHPGPVRRKAGWYISPRNDDAVYIGAVLGRPTVRWEETAGLLMRLPVDLFASSTLHFHLDPCLGKGMEWDGRAVGGTSGPVLDAQLSLEGRPDGSFGVTFSVTSPEKIRMPMIVDGFFVPYMTLDVPTGLVGRSLDASLSPLWSSSGTVAVPSSNGGMAEHRYELRLSVSHVGLQSRGYQVRYRLILDWE